MRPTRMDAIEARRQYMALTVDAGDRYKAESVQYGTDENGKPVLGNRLVDVTSGEFVTGEQAAPPRRSVSQAEVEETARKYGVPEDQVIKQLSDIGVTVNPA